jgi:hypothetical protein
MIRDKFGYEGYVILMSGTPSPKTPVDWWAQCEIAWPGFLKEGSPKALEQRMAFIVSKSSSRASSRSELAGRMTRTSAASAASSRHENHHQELVADLDEYHKFTPSKNEVAFMYERLKGLVVIKLKKDCLTFPKSDTARSSASPARAHYVSPRSWPKPPQHDDGPDLAPRVERWVPVP